MGIAALPATLAELLERNEEVEREIFTYADSNRRIAEATLTMLLADWPAPLRPTVRRVMIGLLNAPTASSLGWPVAPSWVQQLVLQALRVRSRAGAGRRQLLRILGRAPRSRFSSDHPTPSYGDRFELDQPGPTPLLEGWSRDGEAVAQGTLSPPAASPHPPPTSGRE